MTKKLDPKLWSTLPTELVCTIYSHIKKDNMRQVRMQRVMKKLLLREISVYGSLAQPNTVITHFMAPIGSIPPLV